MSRLREIEYRQPALDAYPIWGGYSLNPGLRRLSDWRALESFAACGHESDLSQWFKRHGMGIASLERPACETTGHGRHVHDPLAPASWNAAIGSKPPLRAPLPGVTQRFVCVGLAGDTNAATAWVAHNDELRQATPRLAARDGVVADTPHLK